MRHWELADGLPQNTIQTLRQTPDGYLWLATQGGLVRFDGVRFVEPAAVRALGMSEHNFSAIAVDHASGNLIAGLFDGRLIRLAGNHAAQIQGHAEDPVWTMAQDADGSVWVAYHAQGLMHIPRDSERAMAVPGLYPAVPLRGARASPSGELFVAGPGGVLQREDGQFRELPAPPLRENDRARALEAAAGSLWLGTNSGLYRWADGEWTRRPYRDDPAPLVLSVHRTRAGELLIGDRRGGWLASSDGTRAQLLVATESPATAVFEDAEGGFWVGTASHGLFQVTPSRVRMVREADGLSDEVTVAGLASRDGYTWIATQNGLNRIGPGAEVHQYGVGSQHAIMLALADLGDGRVLVGAASGLFLWKDRELIAYEVEGIEGLTGVGAIAIGGDGSQWIGAREGLVRIRDGRAVHLGRERGLPDAWVKAIAIDDQGRILAGTRRGLYVANGADSMFVREARIPDRAISGLHYDPARRQLWVTMVNGGAYRIDAAGVLQIGSAAGLPSDRLCGVLTNEDSVWFATYQGIARIRHADLFGLGPVAAAHLPVQVLDESDGMGTRECNGGSQPSSFVHPDGTLWFATSRGMAVVHPESIGAGAPPPQVMIEDWRVDGRSLPLATGIEVPIGSRGFVFEFTATRLRAADKTRFRFRLLGYSSEWADAGRRREAWFTNLDPGSYQFEVLAADGDGRWSPHAATFAFAVPTPFHRTPTFVLLTSLGIFGVLFLVHRLRTLNLRARNALLTERNRISRELHDTVAQGLVGIKVQLEVVKRHLDADSPAMEPLCRVQGIADATADEARRSVWALRDGATLDVALEDALSPVAEAVLVNSPVSYRIRCEGSRVRLAGTEQHHVLRIVREALVNVLRHADARSVLIEVHGEPHRATVTLSDDGRGFDPEAMHARSFGLIGMQERAGMLRGGRLYVTSAPGQGTRIRLEWEPDAHGAP